MAEAGAQRAARMPAVAYVARNENTVKGQAVETRDYGYESVGGPIAREYGLTGKNVGVAVIDSGIFDHDDLKGTDDGNLRLVYNQDFTGGDGKDNFGHGTHVAGIIAGNGTGTDSAVIAAILIVCLTRNEPVRRVWRSLQSRVVPYYLAGGVLAGVWSRADFTAGFGAALMAALSVYLLNLWYREMDQPASRCRVVNPA